MLHCGAYGGQIAASAMCWQASNWRQSAPNPRAYQIELRTRLENAYGDWGWKAQTKEACGEIASCRVEAISARHEAGPVDMDQQKSRFSGLRGVLHVEC